MSYGFHRCAICGFFFWFERLLRVQPPAFEHFLVKIRPSEIRLHEHMVLSIGKRPFRVIPHAGHQNRHLVFRHGEHQVPLFGESPLIFAEISKGKSPS